MLKCYQYNLSAVSPIIISPREQQAFFEEYRIYPFYQYGAYDEYNPELAQYYIPGSSIKGALITPERGLLRVDDIRVSNKDIKLSELLKVQHILSKKELEQAKGNVKSLRLEPFYSNVKFEMLESDYAYTGYFFYEEKDTELYKSLIKTKKSVEKKLNAFQSHIDELIERYISKKEKKTEEECIQKLKRTSKNINYLRKRSGEFKENETLMLLGGYKGILLSMVRDQNPAEVQSGIFLDKNKCLPYGLAKIKVNM